MTAFESFCLKNALSIDLKEYQLLLTDRPKIEATIVEDAVTNSAKYN